MSSSLSFFDGIVELFHRILGFLGLDLSFLGGLLCCLGCLLGLGGFSLSFVDSVTCLLCVSISFLRKLLKFLSCSLSLLSCLLGVFTSSLGIFIGAFNFELFLLNNGRLPGNQLSLSDLSIAAGQLEVSIGEGCGLDTVLVDGDDEIFICEPFESQSVLIVISFTLDFKIVDGFLGNEFMRADRLVPRSVDQTNVFIEIE